MAHTNEIESFWSMLKRAHQGTFHKFSPKHLQRYVTEFAGKHNARNADAQAQMFAMIVGRRCRSAWSSLPAGDRPVDGLDHAQCLVLSHYSWEPPHGRRQSAINERLKSDRGRTASLKVSAKGGVSVYGLGRFPVTLYKEQWTKVISMTDEIRAFIKEDEAELKSKPEA